MARSKPLSPASSPARRARRLLAAAALTAALTAALALLGACGGDAASEAVPPPAETGAPAEPPAETAEPPAEPPPPPATEAEPPAPPPAESPPAEPPPETEEPAPPPAEPLPGLPAYTAGYEGWILLNEDPIPPREGGDAHLGTKNVYASAERGPDGVYPDGTIVVKDATRPDADFIGLVAVMRKERGADPEHGDWVFVEWTRSSADDPFSEQARDAVCWGCHMDAAGTDWVWVHTLGIAP